MSGKVKSSCVSLLLICIHFVLRIFLSNYKMMDAIITIKASRVSFASVGCCALWDRK